MSRQGSRFLSIRNILLTFVAGGSVVVGAFAGAVPASAEGSAAGESISDPHALLEEVAPSLLVGDAPQTSVDVGATENLSPKSEGEPGVPVTVTVAPKDSEPVSVPIQLEAATTPDPVADAGITSFNTASDNVKRYVVENSVGASVVTAYQLPQDSYKSSTTFALPAGFYPQKQASGEYYLTNGGEVRGAVMPPWAKDATGRDLKTSYEWDGLTVTQDVEVPADAVFPITADPAWSYTWTAVIKIGDPLTLRTKMHSCFNCTFPVQGAPAAFPVTGQKLPLTVGIAGINLDFTCIFDQEAWTPKVPELYPNGQFGFWFNSAPSHVDGAGSRISFNFWTKQETDSSIKMRFTVTGNITNETPAGMPQWIYLPGAKAQWEVFVRRAIVAVGGPVSTQAQNSYWNWIN